MKSKQGDSKIDLRHKNTEELHSDIILAHGQTESHSKLSKLFNKTKGFAHTNKSSLKIALASGLLLGSTALSSDFITSALGASLVLGTSLYALTKAGDLSVDNVSGLGEKLKISPLMIGLGVGALASVPELLVAIKSVFTGASDIGIGQLVGANIAHVFLILGATAAIAKKGITKGKGLGWKFNTYAMAGTTLLFEQTSLLINVMQKN
jgi:hypothetical protein